MIVNSFRTRAAICPAGAAMVAALTAGTAIAVADANDDAFARAFNQAMVAASTPASGENPATVPFNPPPPDTIYALGRQICSDLGKGTSPDQVAADLTAYTSPSRGLSQQGAAAVVAAARTSYCP
jgi:Protein of unknown function (DUF732)